MSTETEQYYCDDCGQSVIDKDMLTETHEGTSVCQSCLDDEYVTTADGDIIYASAAGWCSASDEYYPDEDIFHCEDCNESYHIDHSCSVDYGHREKIGRAHV